MKRARLNESKKSKKLHLPQPLVRHEVGLTKHRIHWEKSRASAGGEDAGKDDTDTAQQRGRNLVLAIHTTGPMIRATRLLDALAATEARLRAAVACAREADSVVVDVGDSRIDAAVKQLFNKRHYLQMLKSGRRYSTLAKQCRDVNGVVVF